jgi:hypothetical protein
MNIERRRWYRILAVSGLLVTSGAPLVAQPGSAAPTTAVMVSLTIKADADRAQMMKVMPDEVRATVKLYLDGKIQQWYSRSDGSGVMFLMNCNTIAEAKTLFEALPLSKAGFANLEFTALSPLTPLRMLLAEPTAAPKSNPPQ